MFAIALMCAFPVIAAAADTSMSFDYGLTANGNASVTAAPGEIITVALTLSRTDSSGDFPMYAVQGNIRFNSSFFELVQGSVSSAFTTSSMALTGSWNGWTSISASAYSAAQEGDSWANSTELVSFRLRTLRAGTSTIITRDCAVSTADGLDSYGMTSNNVDVIVKNPDSSNNNENNGEQNEEQNTNPGSNNGGGDSSGGGTGGGGGGAGGGNISDETDQEKEPESSPENEIPDETGLPAAARQFTDVPSGSWYEDAVRYVVRAGLFYGTSETTFSPDDNMTRAMLVTVLWRLDGLPNPKGTNAFTDIADGQWYTDAVLWASESGIVGGYGDGLFGTNDSITREQLAAILYRYAVVKGYDVSQPAEINDYADAMSVSEWALEAMRWAVGAGIITGTGNNTLSPAGTAARAQVAAMLTRFDTLFG